MRRRRRAAERREPIDNGITHRCLETEERNLFLPCCVTGRREKRGPISAVAAAAPPLIGRREKIQRHLIPHRSKQLKDFFFSLSFSFSLLGRDVTRNTNKNSINPGRYIVDHCNNPVPRLFQDDDDDLLIS